MKKITLFVTAVFLMGSSVKAAQSTVLKAANYPVAIADAEPIVFRERGVEFFVFADGQFDFNSVQTVNGDDQNYFRPRRAAVNTTYGAPGAQNGAVRIEHDANGRIRRIGNVFMNYDAYGRIKRIGSVYMSYNRFALVQVGGLQIQYDRFGRIIGTRGTVNGSSWSYQPHNGGDHTGNGYNDNNSYNSNGDDDYYYYKTGGTKVKTEVNPEVRK